MSSLVYILLCLSLHACNVHHLVVTGEEIGEGFHHHLSKGLVPVKEKHTKPLLPSSVKPSFSEGTRKQENPNGENDIDTEIQGRWNGANNMKGIEMTAARKEKGDTKGDEISASSSSPSSLLEATKMKEWKGQSRRMLRSTVHDAEEPVDSQENDAAEDIIVMDYAQPHKNAPIHNREP